MTREERIKRVLSDAPESAKKQLSRAFSGLASPRQAIKAFCLTCTGFDRDAIKSCSSHGCPLWAYRPLFTNGEESGRGDL